MQVWPGQKQSPGRKPGEETVPNKVSRLEYDRFIGLAKPKSGAPDCNQLTMVIPQNCIAHPYCA